MKNDELKSLTDEQHEEIRRAYKMGVRACLFLAREIEKIYEVQSRLEDYQGNVKMSVADVLLPGIIYGIDPTMQTLGDLLNGMDAVDDETENATSGAFDAVRAVLEKYGPESAKS